MARAATTSDAFNAVAEPCRRQILHYLAGRERPVGDIVARLRIEQPSVSKHLRVLRDVGLVHVRRDGRQKLYRTSPEAIRPVHEWASQFERFWEHQLDRIKRQAEEKEMAPTQEKEGLALNIAQTIHVKASVEKTFAALIEQLGPSNQRPDGVAMPMKLEAWPGGRWYRDLGNGDGHFWGNVQAIKKPTLLEICGPLFSSTPTMSNVQYPLFEDAGGTRIEFRHTAIGMVADEHRQGITVGWSYIHDCVKARAEK